MMKQFDASTACAQVEEGTLPFTWVDVLRSFEIGQTKRFPVNSAGMVSTIRSHIGRYQHVTGKDFSTSCEGMSIIITRNPDRQ